MERYLEQLIDDINKIIENSEGNNIKDLFVIQYNQFPNANKMTKKQIEQLLQTLENAFAHFRVGVDYGNVEEIDTKYELLRMIFADTNEDYAQLDDNLMNKAL
ncbi:MAG: hypothetical protein U9Q83_07895 [Bacteroidota bacterium]|nr:hypothetical protein [Bacteroidota bacterium]